MISRDQALSLLHTNMESVNLRRHCYAVEAAMKALASHFGQDVDVWGIVGLLHDGDYEMTKDDHTKHTLLMAQWMTQLGETNEDLLSAIKSHNFAHTNQNPPKSTLEWSLYCCDELTGFIVAVTLVRPEKKLSAVSVDNILDKWHQKAFAAGVKREQIESCEEKLGLKLHDFIDIVLKAMQGIHGELGL